jgi:hypothetical protein
VAVLNQSEEASICWAGKKMKPTPELCKNAGCKDCKLAPNGRWFCTLGMVEDDLDPTPLERVAECLIADGRSSAL